MFRFAMVAAVLLWALAAPAFAQTADAAAFADPISVHSAAISPDGTHVAYVRRGETDSQLVIVDLQRRSGRPIQRMTATEGRYQWVQWKNDNRLILGVELTATIEGETSTGSWVRGSDREVRAATVLAVNRDGSGFAQMFQRQIRLLRGSTILVDALPQDPDNVLVAAQDNSGLGVWRASVSSGRADRVAVGPAQAIQYVSDGAGYPVIRVDALYDRSGYRIHRRANGVEEWTLVMEARRAAVATNSPDFNVVASGPAANQVYVLARPEDRDLASVYLYNTQSGELGAPLFTPSAFDAAQPWIDPRTHEVLAHCEFGQRLACQSPDPEMQRYLRAIDQFFEQQSSVFLVDMSADRNKWLLLVRGPTEAAGYYLFDRTVPRISPVADLYPNLVSAALSPTQVVSYAARDGTQLWAYVTAQPGQGPRAVVVMPHGGPEARDYYGYDPYAQFIASRGYVVVQPHFRGSLGSGRAFADAGRGQWGRLMQTDLEDAVQHLVTTGVADRSRVCIVGASYGGYAALAGVSLTPEAYRCAIAIAGVSDLPELVNRVAVRGTATHHYWVRSIGDPGRDRAFLNAVSPREQAAQIRAPVLLIHGEEDDVVEIRQSELMQRALGDRARLVRLPEEGHFWDEWSREHRLTVLRETEAFLAQHNPAR